MTSVLIVDDEYLIRQLIRQLVSWDELGLEVIGEAANGEEALALIRAERPQIALVDINMPFLNGLELAREVQLENLPTVLIILTGYKDFAYAKHAVTYQVFDYLLKPIDPHELTEALERAKLCVQRRSEERHYQRRSKQLQQSRFLWNLALGRVNPPMERLAEEMARHEVSLDEKNIGALAIQADQMDDGEDNSPYLYAVVNILQECMERKGQFKNCYGLMETDNCAILLFNGQPEGTPQALRQALDEGIAAVEKHFSFSVLVGADFFRDGYDEIRGLVKNALQVLEERFFNEGRHVFFHGEDVQTVETTVPTFLAYPELLMQLNPAHSDGGEPLLAELFGRMCVRPVKQEQAKLVAIGIASALHMVAASYGLHLDGAHSQSVFFRRINGCNRFEQMEAAVFELHQRVKSEIAGIVSLSPAVRAAKEYIDRNYSNRELSLNTIAAAVFVAPTYLSNLFKKEMNVSTTEYITICRMRKATRLLAGDRELTLAMVAEAVGYTDPYYFSKCFKKHYGVSASRYLADISYAQESKAEELRKG